MEVQFLEKNSDYESVLDVLLQLRPNYNLDTLSAQIEKQQSHGYQVVYVKSSEAYTCGSGL